MITGCEGQTRIISPLQSGVKTFYKKHATNIINCGF